MSALAAPVTATRRVPLPRPRIVPTFLPPGVSLDEEVLEPPVFHPTFRSFHRFDGTVALEETAFSPLAPLSPFARRLLTLLLVGAGLFAVASPMGLDLSTRLAALREDPAPAQAPATQVAPISGEAPLPSVMPEGQRAPVVEPAKAPVKVHHAKGAAAPSAKPKPVTHAQPEPVVKTSPTPAAAPVKQSSPPAETGTKSGGDTSTGSQTGGGSGDQTNTGSGSGSGDQTGDQTGTVSTVFADNFGGTTLDLSRWTYWWGITTLADSKLYLKSERTAKAPDETYSGLVATKKSFTDFDLSVTTQTVSQLRVGSTPNPWEVSWLLFHFTDLKHYYWFIPKDGGYELGKKQGSDTQIFLVTGDDFTYPVGGVYRVTTQMIGANIQIWVNGEQIVNWTDTNPLKEGTVGLYEEDARVTFDSVAVKAPAA